LDLILQRRRRRRRRRKKKERRGRRRRRSSMKTEKYSHFRSILFGDVKDVYHSVQFLCECMTLDPPS
jgi:hypothetical protein